MRIEDVCKQVDESVCDASIKHIKQETKVFHDACVALTKVEQLASQRLKNKSLLPDHKKQYTKLLKDAKAACAAMKAHLDTYK